MGPLEGASLLVAGACAVVSVSVPVTVSVILKFPGLGQVE